MNIKIYRTKENEKEIQDILNLTMDFESAKKQSYHYVGFARGSAGYSSAHCNNILHGTDMLDAFLRINNEDQAASLYPKANYSFIPVVKIGNTQEDHFGQYDIDDEKIETYLADVVKANDEYLKTEKLIFEFGDFNSRQEEVFDRIRPVIEEFFSRSKFIREVIILLDYKHPFWDRTFFI